MRTLKKPLPAGSGEDRMEREGYPLESMNKLTAIFALTTVVLLMALGFVAFKPKFGLPKMVLPSVSLPWGGGAVKSSGYQAVFLTSGQVYFGKLSGFPGETPILREVYYLQVGTVVEPTPAAGAGKEAQSKVEKRGKETSQATPAMAPKTGLTLVKLGGEVHGPTDELKLNRDQILFVENLRDDSQVVAAIKRNQALEAKK